MKIHHAKMNGQKLSTTTMIHSWIEQNIDNLSGAKNYA